MASGGKDFGGERLRVLLDANVFIADLISKSGPAVELVEACFDGRFVLLYSEGLLDELEEVFLREKFRRWFSVDEGYVLLDVIRAVGHKVDDRAAEDHPQLCVDPDDNYLFSVYEDGKANVLVSGDKGVRAVNFPGCVILKPAEAVGLLEDPHPWGSYLIRGDEDEAIARMREEGNGLLFDIVTLFSEALEGVREGGYRGEIIAKLVVPGTEEAWLSDLDEVLNMTRDRAIATKPWIMAPDVCAMKLVPDLGDTYRAVTPTQALDDVVWLTLVRCDAVFDGSGRDPLDVGGWRPHSIGLQPLDPALIRREGFGQ